jgi:hypothetical protein
LANGSSAAEKHRIAAMYSREFDALRPAQSHAA